MPKRLYAITAYKKSSMAHVILGFWGFGDCSVLDGVRLRLCLGGVWRACGVHADGPAFLQELVRHHSCPRLR